MRANLKNAKHQILLHDIGICSVFAAQAGPGRVQLMARAVGLNVEALLFVGFGGHHQVISG